jgi:hypothetical protein
MKTPAEVYRPSERPWKGTPDDLEYPPGMLPRRVGRHGEVSIRGLRIGVSEALTKWSVGLEPLPEERMAVWFGELLVGEIDLPTASFAPARAGAKEPPPKPRPPLDPTPAPRQPKV